MIQHRRTIALITGFIVGFTCRAIADTVAYVSFEEGSDGAGATGAMTPLVDSVVDSAGGDDLFRTFSTDTAPIYQTDVPVATVPLTGAANNLSLSFDGGDDLYQDAISPLRTMVFTDFTVEAWVRFDSLTGFQTVVGRDDQIFSGTNGQNNSPASLFYMSKAGDNHFRLEATDAANGIVTVESTVFATTGVWYHLAGVGNATAGTLEFFIDGVSVGVNTNYTGLYDPGNDDSWTIGRGQYNDGVVDQVVGNIDEVRWSDAALEPSEFLPAYEPPRVWDRDASNLWSVAANWVDDIAPTFTGFSGSASFAATGTPGGTLNNDVVAAELASIAFSSDAAAFVLDGNPLALSTSVRNDSSNSQELAFDVIADSNLTALANAGPLEFSGVLSGTSGFTSSGDYPVTLSNGANTIAGMIKVNGNENLVITASGALGDPNSIVQLNASYQGPLSSLVFDGGGITQEKIYQIFTRTTADPAHLIFNNGVNTITGTVRTENGGDTAIFEVAAGATLNLNAMFNSATQTGVDFARFVGDGTTNFNGDVLDATDIALGFVVAGGSSAVLNINGTKNYHAATIAESGTLALVDNATTNSVPNSVTLQAVSPDGTLDFSGLLGGGVVLSVGQTLAGDGTFVGSVVAASGSSVSPGVDGIGTMTLPALSLEAESTINIDVDGSSSDVIEGGVITGPSSGTVDIAVNFVELSAGDYVILDWSGGSAVDVDLADFTTNIGSLSIVGSQLILTITIEQRAELLVSDTGNNRVLKYDVSQFGQLANESVFAEGTVGDYALDTPVGLAQDSAGNVYIVEGNPDLQDRLLQLDADGNFLATLAEIDSFTANDVFSGTPANIVVDPTDTYVFMSISQPNTTATDPNLNNVIYRVRTDDTTLPEVYINTTDPNGSYELQNPQGLEFGPDGYLYVCNNLDPASTSPDPGSRVLRFDVSGATGVYAGTLTTEHRETKGTFYDVYLNRLLVTLNQLNDIWAYTNNLVQDYVANDPTNGNFEFVLEQDGDVDYPDVVFAFGDVYFTDSTDNVIRRVTGLNTSTIALPASAGLLNPHSLLLVSETDPFDFDNDGDVDAVDQGIFMLAVAGPGVTTPPVGITDEEFSRADIDNDGDVDQKDAWAFARRVTN